MKKNDVIIIIVVILLALMGMFIINKHNSSSGRIAKITIDENIVEEIDLDSIVEGEEYEIELVKDHSYATVSKEGIKIHKSDCRDQICVETGMAKKNGDMIVCLPYKIVIEVTDSNNVTNDVDAISQ